MSKSDAFEQGLLDLIFKNTGIANIGDATGLRGSTAAGSLYVALHTADPGESGDQQISECTYTGYARVAVTRGAGFTRTGSSISPAANVDFGAKTAGTDQTATHFSIGVAAAGASVILYSGTITPNIAISNGVTPRLNTSSAITED